MKKSKLYSFLILVGLCSVVFAQKKEPILLTTLTGHTEKVSSLAISSDGHWLASGSDSKDIFGEHGTFEIIIWNLKTNKILYHLSGHEASIQSLAFNPDGSTLVSGDSKGTLKVWDVLTGLEITSSKENEWLNTLVFTPNGKLIIGEENFAKKLKVWTANPLQLIAQITVGVETNNIDISPTGEMIAIGCYKQFKIWSFPQKDFLKSNDFESRIHCVKYSPNGKLIAGGLGEGDIVLWETDQYTPIATLKGHFLPVLSVSFSRDNSLLVSGSSDQTIRLWDIKKQVELSSLVNQHKGNISAVCFSPTENVFFSTGEDGSIKVWKLR
ncbi:MAG: WD40 repeat domain-containing protein [Bacteroidota bacterium]|nr:WD40 repeat domain-containing protein [Bacteroidota bacterium]